MLSEHLQRYVTGGAQRLLADRLGLPTDPRMQDWQWEVADPARLGEFLDTYSDGDLDADERFALMEIIVQSVEETRTVDVESLPAWTTVEALLKAAPVLHATTVHYWSLLDDDSAPDDWFRVTRPMRRVWDEIQPFLEPPSPAIP